MSKNAIQQDAELEVNEQEVVEEVKAEEPKEERAKTKREMLVEQINAKALAEILPKEETPIEQETEEEQQKVLSEDELNKILVKTKIDGVEELKPVSDVLRNYQKDAAASKRLEGAAKREKELDEREAKLNELEQKNSKPSPEGDAINQLLDALYGGDRETAALLLKDFGMERESATPDDLVQKITPQIKAQIEVDLAINEFSNEFKDIAEDPYLEIVTEKFVQEAMADGKPFKEALRTAGLRTRDWVRQKSGNSTINQEKLKRKEAMDSVPSLNIKTAGVPEQKPQSNTEIIAEMRRRRGQPV